SAVPSMDVIRHANEMLTQSGVLSNSILLGFPYADVPEMGASTIVVTDNDPELAQQCADRLAARMWENRESFLPSLVTIDEAIEQARRLDGPVCLLDMGDNVGGGGPADSTWLAHALNRPGAPSALVCLCDPVAVTQCQTLGV